MIPKYNVEYALDFKKRTVHSYHYQTDDQVDCQEFLEELLEQKYRILGIHHDGVPLTAHEFDKMVKIAANMLAATHLCASLKLSSEEEHFRFGFGV